MLLLAGARNTKCTPCDIAAGHLMASAAFEAGADRAEWQNLPSGVASRSTVRAGRVEGKITRVGQTQDSVPPSLFLASVHPTCLSHILLTRPCLRPGSPERPGQPSQLRSVQPPQPRTQPEVSQLQLNLSQSRGLTPRPNFLHVLASHRRLLLRFVNHSGRSSSKLPSSARCQPATARMTSSASDWIRPDTNPAR